MKNLFNIKILDLLQTVLVAHVAFLVNHRLSNTLNKVNNAKFKFYYFKTFIFESNDLQTKKCYFKLKLKIKVF